MKSSCLLLLVCLGAASAQTPAPPLATPRPPAAAPSKPASKLPDLPDTAVIAELQDGTKVTMGDLKKLARVVPPQMQNAIKDNPAEFLHEYATMLKYSEIAVEKKLDEESPTKEALYFSRLYTLSVALVQNLLQTVTVDPNEIVNFYGKNKQGFKQTKLKAIYITFSDAPSAEDKSLSEEQAKAKADKLAAQAKAGADFVKLVKENSEDPDSKAKDGDFGTFSTTDPLPDAIRDAVFALEMGEVTAPVRQPHGFYIFKADIVTIRPLSEVRDQIFDVLKQQHGKQVVDQINTEVKVTFPNPAFQPKPAPAAPSK